MNHRKYFEILIENFILNNPFFSKNRFVMPFPDMNRFLSTSHKLHQHEADRKSPSESGNKKHDFHAYLCR
jgi:hypothetical protein